MKKRDKLTKRSGVVRFPQIEMFTSLLPLTNEVNQMAKKHKIVKKIEKPVKKVGRPSTTTVDEKKGKTPTVIFLPNKLRARVRLTCMALNTSASAVVRELLAQWVVDQKKALASVINVSDDDDEDNEDTETEEVEEEEEEEEGEEEEEEEEE